MAGEPKTNQFMLSSASLMLAPMADQLTINPAVHSIGLVKNVQVSADPQFVELGFGITNQLVMSVKNQTGLRVSAEVYEYTPKNLAYAIGLDVGASSYAMNTTTYAVSAQVDAGDTTLTIATDVSSSFTVGKWFFLQTNAGGRDVVHVAKVSAVAYSSPDTTVTFTGFATPTGVDFAVATTRVGLINKMDVLNETENVTFSCRIVGLMAKDKRPVIIHMPKVKVTRGFNMNFSTENFGNLPFELTPYQPIVGDPGYSADFAEALTIFPGA